MSNEANLKNLMFKGDRKKALKAIVDMDLLHSNLHDFATLEGIFLYAIREAGMRHVEDELEKRIKK